PEDPANDTARPPRRGRRDRIHRRRQHGPQPHRRPARRRRRPGLDPGGRAERIDPERAGGGLRRAHLRIGRRSRARRRGVDVRGQAAGDARRLPGTGRGRPVAGPVAAGITSAQMERGLGGDAAVVRAMPNTPSLLGAGVTGLYANDRVDDAGRRRAEAVLATAGATVWIDDESKMDAVTATSGSGPAYVFLLAEAMEEAAIAQGLPGAAARTLVQQTILGAARMLAETGEAPAELRRRVTSPGGTTHAAIETFENGGLRELVSRAMKRATERGRELSAANDEAAPPGAG